MREKAKTRRTQRAAVGAKAKALLTHLRPSDARAIAGLAISATQGISGITEGVHQAVHGTLGLSGRAPGRTGGLTGLIYRSLDGLTGAIGTGIEQALRTLEPLLARVEREPPETPERERVLAALNGVMGDRLLASGNPLAMKMSFRVTGGAEFDAAMLKPDTTASGRLVVLVHGLCVNDLCWQSPAAEAASSATDMGAELARLLGYVPLYLRYNTGLHIAENGRELALQLEYLLANWPQPVTELALIGYSMGGLVIRSACHVAETEGLAWRGRLRTLVCLASPHHGSPLERAGNLIDVLVGVSPYAAPFGQLFRLRSAGITDLRHGLAHPADIPTTDRFRRTPDRRTPLPLPADVRCYALAVTLADRPSPLAGRLTGDGLVPLRSALGQHDDPALCLRFGKSKQAILHGINHMAVPRHPKVTAQVLAWLAA